LRSGSHLTAQSSALGVHDTPGGPHRTSSRQIQSPGYEWPPGGCPGPTRWAQACCGPAARGRTCRPTCRWP